MHYVIDANNLAGVLGILDNDDFDLQLTNSVKSFFKDKNIKVDLVFDSSDYFGDWRQDDNLNIFYTSRDEQYNCADDKIVEIVENSINDKNDIIVVTNDIDLQNRVNSVKIENSSKFALKLFKKYNINVNGIKKCGLSNNDIREINQEIMEIYGSIS